MPKQKQHQLEFKAKVALETLKDEKAGADVKHTSCRSQDESHWQLHPHIGHSLKATESRPPLFFH